MKLLNKKFIFLFIVAIFMVTFLATPAKAAKLYFRMEKTAYKTSEVGFVTLNIDTQDKIINAIEAIVKFNPKLIEVTKFVSDKCIINFWVQAPKIDNTKGTISFKGVILNPAFIGELGRLIGFNFKAKAPGLFPFSAANMTTLANDGKGTSLATSVIDRSISITGKAIVSEPIITKPVVTAPIVTKPDIDKPVVSKPVVTKPKIDEPTITKPGITPESSTVIKFGSTTHPSQKKWYNKSVASIFWQTSSDTVAIAYAFNKEAKFQVPITATIKASSATQRKLTSGVWYAHVRFKNKISGWLETRHFQINIDNEPPSSNIITVLPRRNSSFLPTIRAKAKDNLSGIAYYEVWVGGKMITRSSVLESLDIKNLASGKNIIEVRAFDMAGNFRGDKISVLYSPLPNSEQLVPTTPQKIPIQSTPVTPKPKKNYQFLFN